MSTPPFANEGIHACDCCEKNWDADDLAAIQNLRSRIEAGGIVPSGECPECGALCFPLTFNAQDTPLI